MSESTDPVIDAATAGAVPVRRQRTPEVETEFFGGNDLKGQLDALTLAELRRVRRGGQSICQRIVD